MSSWGAHLVPVEVLDTSTGLLVDPGDSTNRSVRVNVVAGGGAGGTSSTFGAPFPATGTAAGALDTSGNMAPLNLDASGNLKVTSTGGGGGGGPVTIADGADVAEGSTVDAKVLGDVNGTVSAKLRGLNTIWNDVWDSVAHTIHVDGTLTGVTTIGTITNPVTVVQPTGTSLHTVLDSGTLTRSSNPVAVTEPLTDVQLRAPPVPSRGSFSI